MPFPKGESTWNVTDELRKTFTRKECRDLEQYSKNFAVRRLWNSFRQFFLICFGLLEAGRTENLKGLMYFTDEGALSQGGSTYVPPLFPLREILVMTMFAGQ